MRLPCLICCVFAAGSALSAARAAQTTESEPVAYNQHRDTRFGHDHTYPDRGAILRDLPKGSITVSYAGLPYRFHDGVWFEPRGPAFMVVAPPIGVLVPELPTFSTVLARSGQTFLYCNDVYYKPRPDVGGYEVINDPTDQKPEAAAASTGAAAPAAAAAAVAAGSAAGTAAIPTAGTGIVPGTPYASAAEVSQATDAPGAAHEAAVPAAATPPAAAAASSSVAPLAAAIPVAATPAATPSKTFVYPKNGQTADQQARDRYDCYRFAVAQSGFDPMRSTAGVAAAARATQADYERAQGACLDARGYTVR